MLLLVEGDSGSVFAVRDRLTAVPVPDPRVVAEGYGGAAWPVVHYRELEQLARALAAVCLLSAKAVSGRDDHHRQRRPAHHLAISRQPASDRGERRSVKILTLGGSSLWGFGARDDQTIPSLLARSLHEKGWRVELKNLAEIGYVSTQEVIALTRELQAGYRPDVVIFYDGVNDTTSALLEGEPGLTTNEINRRHEFNLLQSPARMAAALTVKLVKDSGSYRFAQMVRRRLDGETASAQTAAGHVQGAGRSPMASSATTRPMSRWSKLWPSRSAFARCSSGSRPCSPSQRSSRSNAKRLKNTPGPSRS